MRGMLHFEPTHPLFADHFPGAPVVPGTLIIRAFQELAGAHMPDWCVVGIRRFRFRRFVAPGNHEWTMEHSENPATGEHVLRCTLFDSNGVALVSGNLDIRTKL